MRNFNAGASVNRTEPVAVSGGSKTLNLSPHDILIAIVGITGAGKTSFIQHFCKETLVIGHGLEACTGVVQVWPCTVGDTKVYLVDTPGFDDTYKSDTDILCEVSNWLTQAYTDKILLAGIVYLHRITDVRLGGSAMKNLRMFRKLCGDEGLGNVVLATTMWDHVQLKDGEKREAELCDRKEFWKYMIDRGSTVFRHDKQGESAKGILQHLINQRHRVTLDIQRDMVDRNMSLNQTAAGQEVASELAKQKAYYEEEIKKLQEEMKQALAKRDRKVREEIEEYKKSLEEKNARALEDANKMGADREQLRRQMEEQHAREREKLMDQLRETNRQIAEDKMQLEIMKSEHEHHLEVQKLELALAEERKKRQRQAIRNSWDNAPCAVM